MHHEHVAQPAAAMVSTKAGSVPIRGRRRRRADTSPSPARPAPPRSSPPRCRRPARLAHQAGTEAPGLHAIRRAAAVEVDLVEAGIDADPRGRANSAGSLPPSCSATGCSTGSIASRPRGRPDHRVGVTISLNKAAHAAPARGGRRGNAGPSSPSSGRRTGATGRRGWRAQVSRPALYGRPSSDCGERGMRDNGGIPASRPRTSPPLTRCSAKPLPGTSWTGTTPARRSRRCVPAAWASLPYTARVHAENIVRKAEPRDARRLPRPAGRTPPRPRFPVVPGAGGLPRHPWPDRAGSTSGLRDAIADQGGDPARSTRWCRCS